MSAITDRAALRYAIEESFGEFASGGEAMQSLLITSEDLTPQFETIEDDTVIGTRRVRDLVRVGRSAEGSINFNLIYGGLDPLLQGALCASWESDVLQDSDEKFSFAFEKHFQDVNEFWAMRGGRVSTLGLTFNLQDIIRGSMGVMGKGGTFAGETIGTGAAVDAVLNESMVTLDKLVIQEGGTPTNIVTEFSFEVDNGLRPKHALGAFDLVDINLGKFRPTGSITTYFESRAQAQKLIDDEPTDFEIVTEDSDGNAYVWIFPRLKFTEITGPNNTGEDDDVFVSLNWTATEDPSTGIAMRVER